jgi:hypothetical protein
MANEEKSTEINIDSEAGQAIQVFEALIEIEGTKALQDKWSILKNILYRGTVPPPPPPPFVVINNFISGSKAGGTAGTVPPPAVIFNIASGPDIAAFGTAPSPPPPPIQIKGGDKVK